jgi:hypothetical protein
MQRGCPPGRPLFGGSNRARTDDPLLVRQVLSLLSYAPDINSLASLAQLQYSTKCATL